MTSSDSAEARPDAKSIQRRLGHWKKAAKWMIAVLVVIGLVFAFREAGESWQAQKESIESQVDALEIRRDRMADEEQRSDLTKEIERVRSQIPNWQNLDWARLSLAGLLYAMGLVPAAAVLRANCGLFGSTPRWSTAIAAQLLGHAGKYVPGKAMVVILRAGALRRDGIAALPASISIFAETFMMMAVGAAMAGIVTLAIDVPAWIKLGALAMALTASLPTLPPVMRLIIRRVAGKTATSGQSALSESAISEREMGIGWLIQTWSWTALSWGLIGGSFTAIVLAIPNSEQVPSLLTLFPICTAAIGLAVVAGFASLLPGGAGVRELVLAVVLGVALGPAHALLAAIAARIIFVVADATVTLLAWIWLRQDASPTDTIVA